MSEAQEITSTGGLFFECIKWVESNDKSLSKIRADVTGYWDLPRKQFDLQIDDEIKAKQISYKPMEPHKKTISTASETI